MADVGIFVFGLVFALIIYKYLPSYFQKKGENLATKEDIEEITDKIESIRSDYATKLESVKADLSLSISRNSFRYEREYDLLRELSSAVINFRDAALTLRPVADYRNPDEKEEERKARRLQDFFRSGRALYDIYESNKPFYTQAIYDEIRELTKIGSWEQIQYQHGDPREPGMKYWDDSIKNAEQIASIADHIIGAIRQRIQEWE